MRIIGLNNEMYVSSACLIEDGKIIAAVAEERLTRDKLTRAFPQRSVEYCVNEAGLKITDIDCFATSWNPSIYFSKFNPLYSRNYRHHMEQTYSVLDNIMGFYGRPISEYLFQEINGSFGKSKVYHITHHRAHAANGYFLSPFESAAILTADSQSEFESTTLCHGKGNKINLIENKNYPHSLGSLYGTFTEYLGFKPNCDEWKVMAMGSFANHNNNVYKILKEQVVKLTDNGSFELDLSFFNSYMHELPDMYTEKLVHALGPARKRGDELKERDFEVASALQKISEDIAVHLLNSLYSITKEKKLVLSGGFFMNSVFNGKVLDLTPFDDVYISSCPDDSGNCFGAAYYLWNHILGNEYREHLKHNYLGPQYPDQEIEKQLSDSNCKFKKVDDVCDLAAKELTEGKIIGWFQGRMEFGQRALGNRSILADPRRAEMKDKVNSAVKFRESFRPFAPAVLKERQDEFFEINQKGDVPFMEKVYPVKYDKRDKIPAVVHIDGTGRIQTVEKESNKRFYELIRKFEEKTDIPVLLNTSFNLNGEPIVCSPIDAIRTFYSCRLDSLFIGDYYINKEARYE